MVCIDPAEAVITATMNALRFVFDPEGDCPPEGGGTTDVHFVGGEGPLWDPVMHMENEGCDAPFLWVRIISRFRTRTFPEPSVLVTCDGIMVVNLEVGVGRCAPSSLQAEPDWLDVAREAEIGRDDSWRLDRAICATRTILKDQLVAAEPIIPLGPDGGGIVWSTSLFVGITSNQE